MPFVEIYSVDFSNGNLHPSLNQWGLPDMVYRQTDEGHSERIADASGITLQMTRNCGEGAINDRGENKNQIIAANSVYVVPAVNLIPVQMRLFTRVTFDQPRAHGFVCIPLPVARESLGEAATPSPTEPQSDVLAVHDIERGPKMSVPEPWAVALDVSTLDTFPNADTDI